MSKKAPDNTEKAISEAIDKVGLREMPGKQAKSAKERKEAVDALNKALSWGIKAVYKYVDLYGPPFAIEFEGGKIVSASEDIMVSPKRWANNAAERGVYLPELKPDSQRMLAALLWFAATPRKRPKPTFVLDRL